MKLLKRKPKPATYTAPMPPTYDVAVDDEDSFITTDGTGVTMLHYLGTPDFVMRLYKECRSGNETVAVLRLGSATGEAYIEMSEDEATYTLSSMAGQLHRAAHQFDGDDWCEICDVDDDDE